MENNNTNYNKSYDKQEKKQSFNNKAKEIDMRKQMQEIDKKLKQKEIEINKELERKQEEFSIKMEQKKLEAIKSLQDDLDDQIRTSINKKMREEEKKIIGSKNRKIITRDIIILLLIAIIGCLMYCLYDLDFYNIKTIVTNKEIIDNAIAGKTNNDDNDSDNTTNSEAKDNTNEDNNAKEQKKEIKPSKYYIENYGYLVENMQIAGSNELYIYKNAISKDKIPNNIKLQIAYKNLDKDKKKTENGTVSFKTEDLQESCQKIFGKDITLDNEIFEYNNSKFLYHDDTYLGFLGNDEQVKTNIIYKIENASEKDDELTFEVIAAKKEENKLISITTGQLLVEPYNGEDISTYKDILTKYKFIFSKVEDNYYFERTEIVEKIPDNNI